MANEITSAFNTAFSDGPSVNPDEPLKSEIRAIGQVIQTKVDALSATDTALSAVDVALDARLDTVEGLVSSGGLNFRASWLTATAYAVKDAVYHSGSTYRCIVAHTSGSTTEPGVGASWTTNWVPLFDAADTPPEVIDARFFESDLARYLLSSGLGVTTHAFRRGAPIAAANAAITTLVAATAPSAYPSLITRVRAWGGTVAGTINVAAFSKSGSVFTKIGAGTDVTMTANVMNEAAVLIYVPAGYYVGFTASAVSVVSYSTAHPVDDAGWYNGTLSSGTFTDATPTTGNARIEVSFTMLTMPNYARSSNMPIVLIADGNSLTIGSGGVRAWPNLLADELRIPIYNFGVGGQNLDAMIADAASQVDPLLVRDGYMSVLIVDGEPYNQLRTGTSVSSCVDKMETYCNARRAAGADYIYVVNVASHNTSTGLLTEGNWTRDGTTKALINAEIASRWEDFADGLIRIDNIAELSDYTDTDYFQTDGIHYTARGQEFVFRAVLRKIKPLL